MLFALISVIVIGFLLYKLLSPSDTKDYWAQYGIRQIDGSPAASQKEILMGEKDVTSRDTYVYQQMGENEQFCGMIESTQKVLFVKDLELAKKILITDFDHFVDRRNFFAISKDSVLNKLLTILTGQEWKNVRAAISPAFTTGKIRRYMESFNLIGKEWATMIKEKAGKSSGVNIKVLPTVNQFTTDVIAAGVFGFDAGTVRNPNSAFAKMATRLGTSSQWKMTLSLHFPNLFKLLNLETIDMEAFRFFQNIVSQGLQARLSGDTAKRNDFLQMMVEVKKGELRAEGNDELSNFEKDAELKTETKSNFVLTDDTINAQSVTFFFAGFSTTSNFVTFFLYSLAAYPDIQEKLREEVRKIVKANGTFDYDDVSQLVYLDMVCCEVLRKFPAALRMERICTKDYNEPETGLFIPKGTLVVIPTKSIHHDKRFYEKPEEFYPEHFSPENKANRNPYAFQAFGSGPRNCVGMRLALIQSKAAIAHVLHNFRIEPTQTTKIPMEGRIGSLQIFPPTDLELKFTVL